jgi:8-oxo-dGTP pyrophosphatase MutT (NUDIX family)
MKKGVGVVLKKNGKILLQLRDNKKEVANPNCWGLFGGQLKEGESPEQAAVREIKEELGIALDKNKLQLVEQTKTNTYFKYPLKNNLSELKLNEGQSMKLFSKKQILILENAVPGLKENIKKRLKNK